MNIVQRCELSNLHNLIKTLKLEQSFLIKIKHLKALDNLS